MFLSNNRLGAVELDPLGHNLVVKLLGAGNLGPRNLGSTQNRFQQEIGSPLDHRRMPVGIVGGPPKLVGVQGPVQKEASLDPLPLFRREVILDPPVQRSRRNLMNVAADDRQCQPVELPLFRMKNTAGMIPAGIDRSLFTILGGCRPSGLHWVVLFPLGIPGGQLGNRDALKLAEKPLKDLKTVLVMMAKGLPVQGNQDEILFFEFLFRQRFELIRGLNLVESNRQRKFLMPEENRQIKFVQAVNRIKAWRLNGREAIPCQNPFVTELRHRIPHLFGISHLGGEKPAGLVNLAQKLPVDLFVQPNLPADFGERNSGKKRVKSR